MVEVYLKIHQKQNQQVLLDVVNMLLLLLILFMTNTRYLIQMILKRQ